MTEAAWRALLPRLWLRSVRSVAWLGFGDAAAPHARRSDAVVVRGGANAQAPLDALHPYGAAYVLFDEAVPCRFAAPGLRAYYAWRIEDGAPAVMDGAGLPAHGPAVLMAVRQTYDPLEHARHCFRLGRPDWALEIIENAPAADFDGDARKADRCAETMRGLLAADNALGAGGRLNRFARAQDEFYKATTWAPRHALAFHCRAEFWSRIGRPDMAAATLRTLAEEDSGTGYEFPQPAAPLAYERRDAAEIRSAAPDTPRILFLTHAQSDYGADVVFDGLCRVLGRGSVVEYPPKPTYTGVAPAADAARYPCTFGYAPHGLGRDAIAAQLEAGRFDYVFLADTLGLIDAALVRSLLDASPATPLVLLDTWDQPGDYFADTLARLGRREAHACFKREMLEGCGYGPRCFPLPFAYPDGLVPAAPAPLPAEPRVFWAGKIQYGARRIVLEHLARHRGLPLDDGLEQEAYRARLAASSAGLCLFGNGFDTVRYWEIPAQGRVLLAQRPPIVIPHNFRDGADALLWDDLPGLEARWEALLAHPGRLPAIAAAGHARLRAHHTGSARARQLLDALSGLRNGRAR